MGPEHLTGVQERLQRVRNAMLGLGAQKANVIFLHDVLGHELPDVAGILKSPSRPRSRAWFAGGAESSSKSTLRAARTPREVEPG